MQANTLSSCENPVHANMFHLLRLVASVCKVLQNFCPVPPANSAGANAEAPPTPQRRTQMNAPHSALEQSEIVWQRVRANCDAIQNWLTRLGLCDSALIHAQWAPSLANNAKLRISHPSLPTLLSSRSPLSPHPRRRR
eukprot:GFKZ01012238.1.p1 GENE.GFKZ01012238.1~~GFKZ01012238.1.p1  ORF type:complete len:138 (-),score=9.22 GFKZ01012238.1:1315-1728(-)